MTSKRIAVLISGKGSTMEALARACLSSIPANIALVVSNQPHAFGLERARLHGLEAVSLPHTHFPDRQSFEKALNRILQEAKIDIICLAGFMRRLTADFTHLWHNKIINIHPALLPSFKGLNVHKRVLAAGVKLTGCTVHFVRADLDDGPILGQAAVPVQPDDDIASLAARVAHAEHLLYPRILDLVARDRVHILDDRAYIDNERSQETALLLSL